MPREHFRLTAPRAVFLLSGAVLAGIAVACGPSAAVSPTPPPPDAFAVVRATSQAAYQAGQEALNRGDLMRGCPLIDTARTADPDNNAAIQRALDQCLTQIPQLLATSAATNAAANSTVTPVPARTIVVPTVAAPAVGPTSAPAAPPTAAQGATAKTTSPGPTGSPVAAAPTPVPLVTYRDRQGRFTVGAPPDWQSLEPAQALFSLGTAGFEWRDPSGVAAVGVSVETTTKAVSPELYAATLELTMQSQVPAYASEAASPTTVAGSPAIRRVFTFAEPDSTGRDRQARAIQVVVLKGQTPYLITALATTDAFAAFGPTFDAMMASFQFS